MTQKNRKTERSSDKFRWSCSTAFPDISRRHSTDCQWIRGGQSCRDRWRGRKQGGSLSSEKSTAKQPWISTGQTLVQHCIHPVSNSLALNSSSKETGGTNEQQQKATVSTKPHSIQVWIWSVRGSKERQKHSSKKVCLGKAVSATGAHS